MRRREPVRVGEALDQFFRERPEILKKFAEARLPEVWAQVVGPEIAKYTLRVNVERGGRMFVYLNSSVVRNEVFMRRAALKEELNRVLGQEVVAHLIVK